MLRKYISTIIAATILLFFSLQLEVAALTETEGNDHIAEANTILLNEKVEGVASGIEDNDYFKINISQKGILKIDFPQVEGAKFNIQIRKEGTAVFAWDHIISEDGHFRYGVDKGTYYIHIFNGDLADKTANRAYEFTTSFIENDFYEAEYNNEIAYANQTKPAVLYSGKGDTSDDKDFFAIQGVGNKMLNISITSGYAALYNADGQLVDESTTTSTINMEHPTNNEMYYLMIKSDQYSFSYTFKERAKNYEHEYNNAYNLANPIRLNDTYFGQVDTFSDVDFYQFDVEQDGLVSIAVDTYGKSDYTLTVYDAHGNPIVEGKTKKLTEHTLRVGLAAGTYSVSIGAPTKSFNHLYGIKLSVDSSKLYNVEKNNSIETAQALPLNATLYGRAYDHLDSDDFYRVTVKERGLLNFALQAPKTSSMQVSIYSADGEILDSVQMKANENTTLRTGVQAGTYYIKISSLSTSDDFYSVKATVSNAGYYEVEKNDTKDMATVLKMNQLITGQIDNNKVDVDWYSFNLTHSTFTTLKFSELEKDSFIVTLYNGQGDIVKKFETSHQVGYFKKYEAQLPKGTYYVEVKYKYGAGNVDYQLSVNSSTVASFSDVPTTHRYFKEISLIRAMGIINGYEDGTYGVNEQIKRHHVAAMIVRSGVDGLPEDPIFAFTFPDVPLETHPNALNIQKLLEAGIIDANPNGFNPNGTLTRAQLAKMLVKAYGLELNKDNIQSFKDVSNQSWYNDYIQILASHNITTGDNGFFNPNAPVTRQHFAVFLYRTLQAVNKIEA
ncbi:S-layer homology domain-containing protein [Solibacillus sp. CAU 1738]|uniref:S-layer homology domain-containing protein n=1 Tax=Solibacillus sp. CAU 1738 TaxID=3140363 RepID=UPI0032606D6B